MVIGNYTGGGEWNPPPRAVLDFKKPGLLRVQLAELQLTPPELKLLCAGLVKAELKKRDRIPSRVGHPLKTRHLPEMPDSM